MKAIFENIWIILIAGGLIGLSILFLFRIKYISNTANSIINDTLKRDGKWSPTRLTMFTAWVTAIWSYHYDVIKNGFDYQAFLVMVGVALGAKVTDAWSKKINPEQNDKTNTDQPAPGSN